MADDSFWVGNSRLIKSIVLGVLVGLAILGYHLYEYFQQSAKDVSGVTDFEILQFSNQLFADEQHHNAYLSNVDLQGRTKAFKRDDSAPNVLLQVNNQFIIENAESTTVLMKRLFDNYELQSSIMEVVSNEEKQEELEFLNAILKTAVMKRTMKFLHKKGVVGDDHKSQIELLNHLWFMQYSRGRGVVGSSGFEHVFMAEMKDENILGLHNWVYFSEQEQIGALDYKGYIDHINIGKDNKHLLAVRFTLHNIVKPYNSILIGTSPELEMSLYTVCFLLRPEEKCAVEGFGQKFNIITHSWDWKGKKTIASAYPSFN